MLVDGFKIKIKILKIVEVHNIKQMRDRFGFDNCP